MQRVRHNIMSTAGITNIDTEAVIISPTNGGVMNCMSPDPVPKPRMMGTSTAMMAPTDRYSELNEHAMKGGRKLVS